MAKQFTVKLVRSQLWTAPSSGGKLKWKMRQERPMAEGDSRLAYYQGKSAFDVFERTPPKHAVAPSARPKKAAPVPAPVPPAPDPVEVAPEVDDSPPGPSIPSDEALSDWLKSPLVDLAVEHGLDVAGMTKPEIRAEIDKIR